jgi:hypothetical protein
LRRWDRPLGGQKKAFTERAEGPSDRSTEKRIAECCESRLFLIVLSVTVPPGSGHHQPTTGPEEILQGPLARLKYDHKFALPSEKRRE